MREIEFRAWDNEANRWVSSGEWLDTMPVRVSLLEEYPPTCVIGSGNYHLMQFTGLKDKNGKKIFEGDILKDGKGQTGQVLWHRNSFLVEWRERDYSGARIVERMYDDCFGCGEIIGNIYGNPELLKD